MGKTYSRFLKYEIDLAPLGVVRCEENEPYFCTPKGASIFGWAGVDGIHFCFIRGFGETVFAVSPMNTAPNYVHPLAESFADFLRLLLSCSDAAALEQAWTWDKPQFEAFLRANIPTEEQKKTLAMIAEKTKLTEIEQPWEYIRALQASFDYSRLRYTEDYYDNEMNPVAPPLEWKVYFDGSFWGHWGNDRPGMEIPIGKAFSWADRYWLVPAAYSCGKGLVVDLCMRVEAEAIRAFMKKWNLSRDSDPEERFTREQRMEMEADNPLGFELYPRLVCNGRVQERSQGCAVSWNPCVPEGVINELEAKAALEHYGLDRLSGWVIHRYAFPWLTGRRTAIKTLSLTMVQAPKRVTVLRFTARAPGDTFRFTHPASGTEYTLTVRELEKQTIPEGAFGPDEHMSFPTHFTTMGYTLAPETEEDILISDCDEGDRPIAKVLPDNGCAPLAVNCAAYVGIIGGADGPTAIALGSRAQGKLRAACSSLHFEPVRQDVEWRVIVSVKQVENADIALIPTDSCM